RQAKINAPAAIGLPFMSSSPGLVQTREFAMKQFLAGAVCLMSMPLMAAEPAPTLEFAFEERVTLAPPVKVGDTAFGYRQYIPISGGAVIGPKLKGEVVPGGWDFQLTYSASECTQLSADYFLKADDGTLIHVFNEGLHCPGAPRAIFRPKLEAPKGEHG